jgi:hypothetical protein
MIEEYGRRLEEVTPNVEQEKRHSNEEVKVQPFHDEINHD